MSTAENGGAGATTSETATNVDPSTNQAKPTGKAAGDDEISMPKSAFNARLERERNAWMKDLGVDSVDAVKAALATAKAAEDAAKTDSEKAASAKVALEKAQADLTAANATMSEVAKATLDGLTEEQRNAVLEVAGDNPALQIKATNALKKTWAAAPAAAATTTPVVQNTLPAQGAPKDTGATVSAPDPKAIYVELMKVNPFAGTAYGEANGLIPRA